MLNYINRVYTFAKTVVDNEKFLEEYKKESNLNNRIHLQVLIAFSFFLLSIANIYVKSYIMLIFTASGCIINTVFPILAKKKNNYQLCSFSAISTCTVFFGFFIFYGGNNGFAAIWAILLPILSLVVMDLRFGFFASLLFQIYLFIILWTPLNDKLLYQYSSQFNLRFPLCFFVTFLLGLYLALSLRKSEYNECKHLIELEEMTKKAYVLARTDPLTKLSNRRCAYEEFKNKYTYTEECKPHCIVMGDIDSFKKINDNYGHEFGDEVLVVFSEYIKNILPQDYLKSRWGGEEFLFVANASIDEVYKEVENLRKTFYNHVFSFNGIQINVSATFGIAEYKNKNDISNAISLADNRLYIGKNTSKNCTVIQ